MYGRVAVGGLEARVLGEGGSDAYGYCLGVVWGSRSGHLGHDPHTKKHPHMSTFPHVVHTTVHTSTTHPQTCMRVAAHANIRKGGKSTQKLKITGRTEASCIVKRSFGPSPSSSSSPSPSSSSPSPAGAFLSNHSPSRSLHLWLQ